MKPSTILLAATLLLLQSCGGEKTAEIKSSSPDNRLEIHISGTKPNFADPWKVFISVKGLPQEPSPAMTEIYASELDSSTVLFDWKNNEKCILTFLQQDGTKRRILIEAGEKSFSLQEL